jgi:F-type H+-transporting ATPase subunit delta
MKNVKQSRRQAKRLFRLCLVSGLLDEGRVRRLVQQLTEAKIRGGAAILTHFLRLVKLDLARHTAAVESAALLPVDLQASIQSGLTRAYGPGISTSFAQNPELIGGVRIKIGSDVYDGSVRGALAALERSF